MPKKLILYLYKFRRSVKEAFPVILFFLLSFALVYGIFGFQYVMLVSVITVFFKVRYKRSNNTWKRYIRLVVVGSLLILLAYLSSRNLAACILLNICVPFVLVFTQSSQFNPKGYFTYAMIFAFTSLIPPADLQGLGKEMLAFWMCVLILASAITVFRWFGSKPAPSSQTASGTFVELSELILLLAQPERQKELEERFWRLAHDFQQMSYHKNFFSVQTRENQLYDMVSALIQRFSYLVSDQEWRKEMDQRHVVVLTQISLFLKETAASRGIAARERQAAAAQKLLDRMNVPEGRIRVFCRSLLHMMTLILNAYKTVPREKKLARKIDWGELMYQFRFRCTLESFEMRFAMRLSIVMTISCTVSYLLPVTHAYWIPLNAFLLLQPSFEESSYRMKTRPIGTVIGCGVEFLVHPLLPGLAGQLVFALLMISLMYCAVPGTWYHPIFSTCYALTLAAMMMNETTAITLRLIYLGAAVLIVFIGNRFFFPMRKDVQFRYNYKALFRLHNNYWNIIRRGMFRLTRLSVSGEILTYFHMLYEECEAYLHSHKEMPKRKELRNVMLILWHMFSELEQMHYLVRTKHLQREEKEALIRVICAVQEDLYPIISYENIVSLRKELPEQEREIGYVLTAYLKHAELLLNYRDCIPF
ncbi:FUSC family protein [Anaerostipes butyraticus]|uniref:FUSC family protein n=1 Tax=Anaerostipes butyraticus TaxID=645466 RepID=UPI00191622A6|nr:FUSC family protein [Anaerostipes butyraticus]